MTIKQLEQQAKGNAQLIVLLKDFGEYKAGVTLSYEAFAFLVCDQYPNWFSKRAIPSIRWSEPVQSILKEDV